MKDSNIYLYGMILITNSFLLKDDYPEADTYAEMKQKYALPGGETGTCATVLASLGCNITMDGTYMGTNTYDKIIKFYENKSVETSSLYLDNSFDGLEDYVLIDKNTRTVFGTFGQYFSDHLKRWSEPKKEDILSSKVVGLDPFFMEQSNKVAVICNENNKPFVTIDCPYDTDIHRYSSINVLSNEYISSQYKNVDRDVLFQQYINNSKGLVIFTHGLNDIMFGRKNQEVQYFKPFKVKTISTLGAGDSFKAGCVYALLHKMSDNDTVSFASATAACACTRFPIPLNPPTLDMIKSIQIQA